MESLLTLEEITELVDNGDHFFVEDDASKRSRAMELITSAEDCIKEEITIIIEPLPAIWHNCS